MIKSFKCRETKRVWEGDYSQRWHRDVQKVARRKLRMLNNARILRDLAVPPRNCLEALKRNRKGQHSIGINDQWRICFKWRNGDAHDVEITDYH